MPATLFPVSDDVRQKVEAVASIRREPKDAVLFRHGDPALGVYLIRKGTVVLDVDGGVRHSAGPGTVLGLPAIFSGKPYSLGATAAEDCEFAFVPRERFLKLVRSDPTLALELLAVLANQLRALREAAGSTEPIKR